MHTVAQHDKIGVYHSLHSECLYSFFLAFRTMALVHHEWTKFFS